MLTKMRPRPADDGGYSLVELLVVMLMMAIVGAFVATAVITSVRSTQRTEARTFALTDIQRGIERVGRELRAANPIELDVNGDFADGLAANVTRDGQNIRFRYYLEEQPDGSVSMLEDVRRTTIATGAVNEQNGLFIADIANLDTGTPLFTYYGTHPVTRQLAEIDCSTLTADQCRAAHQAATQIELTLEKYVEDQDMIVVRTMVNVRNTRLG